MSYHQSTLKMLIRNIKMLIQLKFHFFFLKIYFVKTFEKAKLQKNKQKICGQILSNANMILKQINELRGN